MTLRALILDDDPLAAEALAVRMRALVPDLTVTWRETPHADGDHDVYFVDNEFGAHRVGPRIVTELRAERPDAVIVAVSGTLDQATLKQLLNAGCDLAVEKGVEADLRWMVCQLRERLDARRGRRRPGPLRSLLALVRELNRHAAGQAAAGGVS